MVDYVWADIYFRSSSKFPALVVNSLLFKSNKPTVWTQVHDICLIIIQFSYFDLS